MNKIDKFLSKLDRKERERLEPIIVAIVLNDTTSLDVKKLRGRNDEYRVRTGSIRIQYKKYGAYNFITEIEFRNDNTY